MNTEVIHPRAPTSRCAKAHEVLPPALLALLQQHVHSRFLYIPSPASARRAVRDREIARASAVGAAVRDLATEFGLTERRIGQILARARQGGAA